MFHAFRIHRLTTATFWGDYPLPFAETYPVINIDKAVFIKEYKKENYIITNKFNQVTIKESGIEDVAIPNAIVKVRKDYEPEIEEVYEGKVRIESIRLKK